MEFQTFTKSLAITLLFLLGYQQATIAQSRLRPLAFDKDSDPTPYTFQRSSPDEPYLMNLYTSYALEDIVAGKDTDLAKVRAVCSWVHNRWTHDGRNEAKKADPISILQEAAMGQQFQCVEYSIVIVGALTALGIPARPLNLKTADVEIRRDGAGHAVAEAWLRDQQKWVMVDGQWDVVPMLNDTPLNAVELQAALASKAPGLRIETNSETKSKPYFSWLADYLYYFDTVLDTRFGVKTAPSGLMLVPMGAKKPTVFQHDTPISRMRYTHSVSTFYQPVPSMTALN
ncbi:Transglutaminase-like superfamily protein [Hymenobacter daecheongensis DSM 21074]|uniref:Transglutaminase-like superfamily protein n=1 Tax=Hymenobacter daecheongensis DSM 21074 TaxID=1121955 RepID=A0A1M6FBP0_9BACT|nr:transglutaminase-like domain-containing protein [Hymenobacter daecheongensis]SHI95056.1 Transglutaminase-like superfamily protein [Hymenobacter daecheongensis DSM 21074]